MTPTLTTMPKKKPKIKEHPSRIRMSLWSKMMSTTKIPSVSFVAANVQSINEDRKRASLFSNLRSHNADVFLLSETGRPPPKRVAQWTQDDSLVVTIDPESPPNNLRASFSFPERVSDATFCVGDSKVRVVSIYAPYSDKPDKKRFLSHISTTLRRVMRDDLLPPAPLVGGD
ncbi:BQ2448_5559 [Microbotryum intermedium]|uniref:BQ2448_5559 protein n=1 Tax=Microbotryum intermedium TaxID=269621 RepID=A0A238F4X2_9BASI|nr:BQ2448_5559 [Microbotryum intermedium]